MGMIKCVCISKERKSSACSIQQCEVTVLGMKGDIHYGMSQRRHVSMLPFDKIKDYFDTRKEEILYGRFGENLVVEGMDWDSLQVGQRLCTDSVVLEIVRIGAATPASDAYQGPKVCVPMEPYFVFCRVLTEGVLRTGTAIY